MHNNLTKRQQRNYSCLTYLKGCKSLWEGSCHGQTTQVVPMFRILRPYPSQNQEVETNNWISLSLESPLLIYTILESHIWRYKDLHAFEKLSCKSTLEDFQSHTTLALLLLLVFHLISSFGCLFGFLLFPDNLVSCIENSIRGFVAYVTEFISWVMLHNQKYHKYSS